MKRLALILILLTFAAAAGAEGPAYETKVIGAGALTFDQPRAIFVGSGGRIYLVEGEAEWAVGRMISADLATSTRLKPAGTLPDNTPVKWFHPASIHPMSSGDLLVADTGRKRILRLTEDGAFKDVLVPPGPPANLEGPTDAVRLTTGEIVVCDSASSRLVLFDADGVFRRVLAAPGSGPDQVNHPYSLALDAVGRLWTVDTLNRRLVCRGDDLSVLRVVHPQDASGPVFRWPSFVAVELSGNLLVADDGRSCVFRLAPGGEVIACLGMRAGERQPFARVSGVASLPDGTALASDAARNVLVHFAADGSILGEVGWSHRAGWGGWFVAGGVDASGGFFLVESQHSGRARYFGPDGVLRAEFAGSGTEPGKLTRPRAAATGPDGRLYVADSELHRVTVYRADGSLAGAFGRWGTGEADLRYPRAIAVGLDGAVYVGDAGNRRIQVYTAAGEFLRTFAGNVNPLALDVDRDGRVAVFDDAEERLVTFARDGREISRVSATGIRPFSGMAFAADGRVLVLDVGASAVRAFTVDPDRTPAGGDDLVDPRLGWGTLLVHGPNGRVYAANQAGIYPVEPGRLGAFVAARQPVEPGRLLQPASLALVWGDALAVLSRPTASVQVFGRDGTSRGALKMDPEIRGIERIAAAADGDLLVLSSSDGVIYRVAKDGRASPALAGDLLRGAAEFGMLRDGGAWVMGREMRGGGKVFRVDKDGREIAALPRGRDRRWWGLNVSVTPKGEALTADQGSGVITAWTASGEKEWTFNASALADAGRLRGVAATWMSPSGELWALGSDGAGIRVYAPDRAFVRAAGPDAAIGGLSTPSDFAVDADGTIYIADTGNNRVVKLVAKKPAGK